MSRVVIIGSGIAGLFAALKLEKAGHEVIIITKQRPEDSSTNWAQGGIAGILDKTDGKGMESHIADTLLSAMDCAMKKSCDVLSKKPVTESEIYLQWVLSSKERVRIFIMSKKAGIHQEESYMRRMLLEQKLKERSTKLLQKVTE